MGDLVAKEIIDEPAWIGSYLLPKGGRLLFGGETKCGKSFLLLELARALSLVHPPFACDLFPVNDGARVLVVEQELGEKGLQDRVRRIFSDSSTGDRLWYVSKVPQIQLNSMEGRDLLCRLIDQTECNVLMLDPIGKCHTYDENSNTDIARLWSHLETIQWQYRAESLSLVISHHFGKPSTDPKYVRDPLDINNFRGASKWISDPDTIVAVQKLGAIVGPHKAWRLKVGFTLRHGEELPPMILTVNRDDDRRVLFEKFAGEK